MSVSATISTEEKKTGKKPLTEIKTNDPELNELDHIHKTSGSQPFSSRGTLRIPPNVPRCPWKYFPLEK